MEQAVIDLEEFQLHQRLGPESLDDPDSAERFIQHRQALAQPDRCILRLALQRPADAADHETGQRQQDQQEQR